MLVLGIFGCAPRWSMQKAGTDAKCADAPWEARKGIKAGTMKEAALVDLLYQIKNNLRLESDTLK